MDNKTVVLFSVIQDAFHIENLKDYISSNVISCLEHKSPQYHLVFICDTYTQASEFIKSHSKKFYK